ncbi:MAG: hypothetical protein NZV14_14095 [Bryobacteraceae bacterium]|nr:hypothetical protein [Bryobacteraceae bacterium]MDW8379292.1 DUF6798 domain-containing protein [Bryobacterales bacterium]
MKAHLGPVCALAALTAISFFHFPGHTYLQSDTQIYVPILERLWDSSVLAKDLVAQKPHVAFTMYDEVTLGLRRLTGMGVREGLFLQQIFFRFAALLGVYLFGLTLQQGKAAALLVAACLGLGATIVGPAVLVVEYEPNPRTNAIALILLATGLVAHRQHFLAGVAAGTAFLYHVPAVYPFWLSYFVLSLIPSAPDWMRRRIQGLAPMAVSVLILFLLSQWQPGVKEKQEFFATIDASLEKMMRERAPYNWISLWPPAYIGHYLFYAAALYGAWFRLRSTLDRDVGLLLAWMPALGLLSMPVSYLLLERAKWILMPQLQPMRALLYVVAVAVILTCSAGVMAARAGRWPEALAWFLIAYSPSSHTRTVQVLFDWSNPAFRAAALTVVLVAACAVAASRWRRAWPALVVVAFLPYWAMPALAKVRNYPALHHAELDELSRWAREKTPREAVFLFPDMGKALVPGVFRAQALRTVYVDWKGGGQINFLRDFIKVWLPRWQETMAQGFLGDLLAYRRFDIDYVVLSKAVKGQQPVFENRRYYVYKIR